MNNDRKLMPMKNGEPRSKRQTDKLISSIEESAGINARRRINLGRFCGAAAALCVMSAAVTAAGSAYVNYFHKHSVDKYISSSENGADINYDYEVMSSENEHLRVTIDKILCDGENSMMIVTVDSLDGTLLNSRNRPVFYTEKKGEEKGGPALNGGGYASDETQEELEGTSYSCVQYFTPSEWCDLNGEYHITFSGLGEDNDSLYDGISFDVSFEKNVDTAYLYDAKGRELMLSQFGVSAKFDLSLNDDSWESFYYVFNDGTKQNIPYERIVGCWGDSGSFLIFSEISDINDYKGIEINGVEYLKK